MLKTNTVKRISAFFLALMMILGTLPLNVFAEGLQGKTADPIVIDSSTINEEEPADEEDSTTGSKTHVISFNPNGGSGEMKPVEVADGKNYTLPKNEFKAPEGKEFKNWLIEDQEQKEGYTLVVTRDLEIKAQWEEVKENPIKKTLNSLLGKENKEELNVKTESAPMVKEDVDQENSGLEISEEEVNDAVKAVNDDPRYALFNDVPESVFEGGVDLATDEEKAQGKFNRITSVKVAKDPKNTAQNEYVLKIEGETNITSDTTFYIMPKLKYFSINYEELKDLRTEEEILANIKLTEGDTSYNEYYRNWVIESIRSNIKDDNYNKEIGWVQTQKISINNIENNVEKVKYSVIMDVQHTELSLYTKKLGEKLPIDINAETPEGLIQIGKANVPVLNIEVMQDEPTVRLTKGENLEGSVEVNDVSYFKNRRDENIYSLVQENGKFLLSQNAFSLNRLMPFPSSYIEDENFLEYNLILNKENFVFNNNSKFAKNDTKEAIDNEGVIVKLESPDSLMINYKEVEIAENPNLFDRSGRSIMRPDIKERGFRPRVYDFHTENGDIKFNYHSVGDDKRSSVVSFNIYRIFNNIIPSFEREYKAAITLKDITKINEDGSYNIPFAELVIKQNGEEIKRIKYNISGQLSIPSGSSFSELYKITHEDREEVVEIPIETERIADDTMLKGEEKVVQEGEVGSKKVVYDVQFVDGVEYSKIEKSSEVIEEMKPRIIHYGTAEKLVDKTTEAVKYDTIYEADETLNYEEKKTTQQGKDGSKEVTTTTTLIEGERQESKDEVITVEPTPEIIKVGNKKVDTEKLPFKTIEEIDKTLKEGETKIKVKGVEGLKTTTTIYEVDKETGKLINPKETVTTKDPVDQIVLKGTKPDPIKTSIEAKVKYFGVGGAEEKPEAGKYKFVLKDSKGKVVSEATNDKGGNIVFKELNITDQEIGSHKYTVEQVKGDDLTVEYDTHVEDVTVDVSLSDDNKLSAKVTYDKDGAVFENRLNTTSLQIVRLAEGEKPFVAEEVKNDKGLVVSHKISDKDKAKTLDGAEYDIYKINSDGTETKVTSIKTENGISNLVENLLPGKYKLKETKAPKGYLAASKDLEFEITKEDAGKALVKFASGEDNGAGGKIMEMPSTGGQGTKALMIGGGVLLITMAGVFVLASKKKKELNK